MSNITTTFALSVRPRYMYLSQKSPARTFNWSRAGNEIIVSVDSIQAKFKDEGAAWKHAYDNYPDVLDALKGSDHLGWRAFGLRGDMILTLGMTRVEELQDAVNQEVLAIFEQAMRALDATKLSKAAPSVLRVAKVKSFTWLEVRAKVRLPYETEPTTLSVRCMPSPVEDRTWSVRLRLPGTSDFGILETQSRYEELVRNLSYQGITVKDVQNGTCLDL